MWEDGGEPEGRRLLDTAARPQLQARGIPRAAMSSAAPGGLIVVPATWEDFCAQRDLFDGHVT
jgi:hypothetical protein